MDKPCRNCGSTKIIPEAEIRDQGQHSDGRLKTAVDGNPDALIFKDRVTAILKARVCGDCGYAEIYAQDPRALYEKYRQSIRNRQDASDLSDDELDADDV
jgi:hypothetical protein